MTSIRRYFPVLASSVLALGVAIPAYAQTTATTGAADCSFTGTGLGAFLQEIIGCIDNFVIPVVFALAFILFIIGVYRYFIAGGANEEKRKEGQQFVMWALIGFVLMFSVWGIVRLLVTSLGFNGQSRPDYPQFNAKDSKSSGTTFPTTGTTGSTNTTDTPSNPSNPQL